MSPASPPRHAGHSLNEVAKQLAPHLRIISASRPTPVLRDHNVLGLTRDGESGRRAVLAVESIERADEMLGTVVMGAVPGSAEASTPELPDRAGHIDPEGVGRQVLPRVFTGGLIEAIVGAFLVGGGALILGATGWKLVGAAVAGAMLMCIFGAIWLTFAALGGSDAYRQTFVNDAASDLTIVSVHTDDAAEAASARARFEAVDGMAVISVDRFGQVLEARPNSNTQ